MRLVADRHKVKVLHSWQGVVRTGNGNLLDWQIMIKKTSTSYKLLNALLPQGCCWHPITWFPPGKVGAHAYLLERVDFDNVKRSLLFGGRQQRVSQKLHDMIGG